MNHFLNFLLLPTIFILSKLRVRINLQRSVLFDVIEAQETLLIVVDMLTAIRTDSFEFFISLLHILQVTNAKSAQIVLAAGADKHVVEVTKADRAIVAVFQFVFLFLLINRFNLFHFHRSEYNYVRVLGRLIAFIRRLLLL